MQYNIIQVNLREYHSSNPTNINNKSYYSRKCSKIQTEKNIYFIENFWKLLIHALIEFFFFDTDLFEIFPFIPNFLCWYKQNFWLAFAATNTSIKTKNVGIGLFQYYYWMQILIWLLQEQEWTIKVFFTLNSEAVLIFFSPTTTLDTLVVRKR